MHGVLALSLAIYFYCESQWLGFPDGHLTQVDRVRKRIAPIYQVVNAAFSFVFFYLGRRSEQGGSRSRIAVLLFSAFVTLILIVNLILAQCLEDGTGE